MDWFWGSKPSGNIVPLSDISSSAQTSGSSELEMHVPSHPLFALDQLKASGVPLKLQMTPYLQMDSSVFTNSTPQIIMPEGYEQGRGKFEVALGFIGAGVGTAYLTGCARGFFSELLFNPETLKLSRGSMTTRLLNATTKYGSGYAQTVGSIAFMYSAFEIFARTARSADDPFNAMAAGLITGGLYRASHGFRHSAIGAGFGLAASIVLELLRKDYDRIDEIIEKTRILFRA